MLGFLHVYIMYSVVVMLVPQNYALMESRELELVKIRDGQLKATRKARSTAKTKLEAFNKYIRIFYDLQPIEASCCFCTRNHAT